LPDLGQAGLVARLVGRFVVRNRSARQSGRLKEYVVQCEPLYWQIEVEKNEARRLASLDFESSIVAEDHGLVASAATAASATTVAATATAAAATAVAAAATAAAATESATATTAAAATRAVFARLGFIDGQRAAVVLLAIEARNRGLRLFVGAHLHESKALTAARVAVRNDFRRLHASVRREQLFQIRARCVVAQITYV